MIPSLGLKLGYLQFISVRYLQFISGSAPALHLQMINVFSTHLERVPALGRESNGELARDTRLYPGVEEHVRRICQENRP